MKNLQLTVVPVVSQFTIREQLSSPDQIAQLVDRRLRVLSLTAVQVAVENAAIVVFLSSASRLTSLETWLGRLVLTDIHQPEEGLGRRRAA